MVDTEKDAAQGVGLPRPAPGDTAAVPSPATPDPQSAASVWDRVKRHKVVEWTLAYIAFGYATLHGAEMLRDAFEWSPAVPRFTFLALALGLPIAMTLAWYHGHRAQHRVSRAELATLVALLLVAGSALWLFARNEHVHVAPSVVTDSIPPAKPLGDKSIAVLPFADMSERKDQEYFADGIAQEVLDRLAKVPGLKVVGRTSSFQFKGKSAEPSGIGAALGVSYLLEGSVRRNGERVRVTAQLIDTGTGSQRWSDHFDSDVVNVLHVQDTIAVELARALQIAVEVDTTPHSSIKSPEALDAYLRGLQSVNRGSQENSQAAVADFQKALSLDPTFAPAAIALAQAYAYIGTFAWLPPRVAFERAREAAILAQRLDPKSPTPHVTLGEIHLIYDWDWAGADQEFQRAFALGPRDEYGALMASYLAATLGHWDEALQLAAEAVELDPLNAEAYFGQGWAIFLRSGHLAEAENSMRRVLQIEPDWASAHYFLGEVLMLQGHVDAALAEFGKETLDDGQLEGSAMAYFAARRKADSDTQLAEAIRRNGTSWASEVARIYAFRGEKERALEWLDRAYESRDEDLYDIVGDPLLKNLEGDPRYKAFLHKMNLPE
jgi:TolB-like protein/tetratricopeptide (TPR) repeat protein